MCEYEVQAAHSPYPRHHIDKKRLFPSRLRIFTERLPKRYVWRKGAKDPSGKISGFYLELERLEAELNDIAKVLPSVHSVRADSLHRDGNDLVAADELLGQCIARLAVHRRLREKGGDFVVDSVLLVFRSHGILSFIAEAGSTVEADCPSCSGQRRFCLLVKADNLYILRTLS